MNHQIATSAGSPPLLNATAARPGLSTRIWHVVRTAVSRLSERWRCMQEGAALREWEVCLPFAR
jgi:hypothetical protein